MRPADFEEVLFRVFPRKVSVDASKAEEIVIELRAFWRYRSGNCDPRGEDPRIASPPDGDRRRGGANDGRRITRRTDGGLRGVAE